MWRSAPFAVALALAGCGLAPVYSDGSQSVAANLLANVAVAPIPERSGFLVRQALLEQLGKTSGDQAYRLEVGLDDQIVGFGVRGDNSAARQRRTLRARFRLVEAATNRVVLDDTVASDAGIDRVSSNYAVVAAEDTALERLSTDIARQIAARLARHARTVPQAAQ